MPEVVVGMELPALEYDVTVVNCVTGAVVTVDFFPGLIDPDYARSVGHKTVFMNTMTLFALMDRFVLARIGGDCFIRSHELTMHRPTYAGTTVKVNGSVTLVADEPSNDNTFSRVIDVVVVVSDAKGTTASGTVSVSAPAAPVSVTTCSG